MLTMQLLEKFSKMLLAVLISLVIVLGTGLGFACFYLVRFARIIMSVEDVLAGGLETFERTQLSLENLLQMQMFFESKDVKDATQSALDDVTLSKMAVTQAIREFTRLSKQKYEMVRVDDEVDDDQEAQDQDPVPQRMGR
jgi:hypothetical protein